jgi:hypothetical protein
VQVISQNMDDELIIQLHTKGKILTKYKARSSLLATLHKKAVIGCLHHDTVLCKIWAFFEPLHDSNVYA